MFGKFEGIVLVVGFMALVASSMAAVDDCSNMEYWNGTHCASCSPCPIGYGVKTKCSSKQNTECQRCWPGFDYSNTSSFDGCIECNTFSNCLLGNPKTVKKCTIFSPPVCDGCEDGYYRDPAYGENGSCLKCSPSCSNKQEEARPCNTKHDRKCIARSTAEPTIPILSTPSTVGPSTKGPVPTENSEGGTEEPSPGSGESSREETPLQKRPWLWVGFVAVVAIVLPATVFILVRRRRRSRKKRIPKKENEIPMLPRGLDLPVKYLEIDKKKDVARMLNGKDNYGYFYWQIVAEKLGLNAECRAWEGVDNPTEKLLSAYGETEGSTVRNLIKAVREAGLTHFANEIEKLVSTTQVQGDAGRIEEVYV